MILKDTVKQLTKSISSSLSGTLQEVEFSITAPGAKKVFLAGQFNEWNTQSIPLKKSKDGTWKVKLKLPRGRCEYKYFMDGNWVQNTSGTETVLNSFGTSNCVINIQ